MPADVPLPDVPAVLVPGADAPAVDVLGVDVLGAPAVAPALVVAPAAPLVDDAVLPAAAEPMRALVSVN
ncbi:MAG TPA: hypothetical protein VM032_04815 [Vicinamibacterales bacterium]|nr:hypothetical protein [Vicinamibacterales bacterium]